MNKLFSDVSRQLKIRKEEPTPESWVFHAMKISMSLSLLSCILCTLKTYIGDNINCITGFSGNEHKAVETYCFISSTYSVVNLTLGSPHYGIGPHNPASDEDDIKEHAYYQWVPFMLVLQTAVYYFPRWLWKKAFDKKKFLTILGKLDQIQILQKDETVAGGGEKRRMAGEDGGLKLRQPAEIVARADYLTRSFHDHTIYALQFLFCEIISFVIAVGNLFVTDAFLGGSFMKYGNSAWQYVRGDATDMDNPLNRVFPKITKCNWYKYGPSGSIQTHDALCVLPLNIVNEKTYIVLWYAYIVTTAIVSAVLLFHLIELVLPPVRHMVILKSISGKEEKQCYKDIKGKLNYGDWFVLNHLSKRMVTAYFSQLIKVLTLEINK